MNLLWDTQWIASGDGDECDEEMNKKDEIVETRENKREMVDDEGMKEE